jgi:undecaprenyl diphosphate synthase
MSGKTQVPTSVGILLDGNRRWAKAHNVSAYEGHRRGMMNVEPITLAARDIGVKHLFLYGFSTENWNRTPEEVDHLLAVLEEAATHELSKLTKEGIRVRFIGQRERFSDRLQKALAAIESQSSGGQSITLWICISYGSRAEIVHAAREAARAGEITEESLAAHLWTSPAGEEGVHDIDLIIRTSGAERLSNFLLWQAAYSELYFTDVLWPDFSEKDLKTIVEQFAQRKRNFGA